MLLLILAPLLAGGPRPAQAQAAPISRELLAIIDSSEQAGSSNLLPTRTNLIHGLAEMPLNWLGVKVHYLDLDKEPLPSDAEMRRYLGLITWFGDDRVKDAANYLSWLSRQLRAGKRALILGTLGAGVDRLTGQITPPEQIAAVYGLLGLDYAQLQTDNPTVLSVRRKDSPMVEFERTLEGEVNFYERLRSVGRDNKVYLTINRSDLLDGDSDVVVTGPWGGFALATYEYYDQPRTFQKRWRINPFAFFEEALGLKGVPHPDISTLNGSRVFYSHVDGDGFNNITELDFSSLSSEILLNRFIKPYDLPFTISLVVNDIDPNVLGGPRQLKVAREIFAQPNVEPASHTYSHPFDWTQPVDIEREIRGALDFLNQRVATPEKPVQLVLWSGSTNPQEAAVARADELNLYNINGGDGRFDNAFNSYANLAPLTTQVGQRVQYYTSNANDNIYGNDWTGPYYGLTSVIQTWERSESPRRIGAMNVYYHIFTGEKIAAVNALKAVYDYALAKDIAPMFTTEYLQLVKGFFSTELIRQDDNTWRARNYGTLRTLRFDNEQRFPDLARSQNVVGYWQYQGSLYVFLGEAPESLIALSNNKPTQPYIARASHRILDWKPAGGSLSLALEGVGQKKVTIGNLRPNREFDVVETSPSGERRLRLKSDDQGNLAYSSNTKGRVQLSLPNAVSGRPGSGLEGTLAWLADSVVPLAFSWSVGNEGMRRGP